MKTAREYIQKTARERINLPVNFPKKVPVNAKKYPWTLRENWRSRALLRFTGKKNTVIWEAFFAKNYQFYLNLTLFVSLQFLRGFFNKIEANFS